MSTYRPDAYVYCDIPSTPAGEVVMTTVHTEPDNLAPTGIDPTIGLALAWALILVGAVGMVGGRRMFRAGRARSKAMK